MPTTPPRSKCSSYFECQENYIKASNQVNKLYLEYIKNDSSPGDSELTELKLDLSAEVAKLDKTIYDFDLFLENNKDSKTSGFTKNNYDEIRKMRKELAEQSDILKSRYGSPKEYGEVSSIYDEYRINYNSMVYIFIVVSLIAATLLFILFRSI
jgi:hypothetical protein